ncbi:MAG: gliding motility-associated ABC transporter ATP-binding subunit GldA [Bacteroidetes bacterium]|nr:gliding motility-associated ABC transporter ATP-binding subunit GldA [Bacteroidota bacterium]
MSVVVNNVSKVYGTQYALRNVSLTINRGEIVGLLGPNGAGKSTLMKILTCFIPPTSGTAAVMGYDVQENPLEVQRLVGYLPETNPLYTDMYIREYLAFVAGLHNIKGQAAKLRIEELIALTGLEIEIHKKIGMLSKGYRQRVGLAQAMIHDPQVLILDEPTAGLDPNQLLEIRQLIQDLGRQKTVILSTHIMQEVEAVCNRVIIINKGSIVADDTTENITKNTGTELIEVELGQRVDKQAFTTIEGLKQAHHLKDNIWQLEPRKETDIRPGLMRWATRNNITILSMKSITRSMEESFHQLTGKK